MDVEISIDVKNYLEDLDVVILVSGDSDFLKLIKDCHREGKKIEIYSFESFLAWELKKFAINHPKCNFRLLDNLESRLKYN